MALELGPATGRLINSKSPGTANNNSQRIINFDRTPIKIRVRLMSFFSVHCRFLFETKVYLERNNYE